MACRVELCDGGDTAVHGTDGRRSPERFACTLPVGFMTEGVQMAGSRPADAMRVVAWNIRQGGGSRCGRIVSAIGALAADLVVISEYLRSGSASVSEMLAAAGLHHQLAACDPLGGHGGLLVAASEPFESGPVRYRSESDGHRFAHLVVSGWHIGVAYIPAFEPPRIRKQAFWRFLLDEVEPVLRSSPALVVGDLNTGLHYRDEPGATFVCALEMAEFEVRGWRDGWIAGHRSARPPATWWSPQLNTPYRLDHALLSPVSSRAVAVDYPEHLPDGTPIVGPGGLSDHLPLVVDLPRL